MNIVKLNQKATESIPVTCNAKILSLIVDLQTQAFETNKKSLASNLINELTRVFGKHTETFKSEYNHKIWVLGYKDLVFNVFSASGGGTSIEICNMEFDKLRKGEREKDIIDFLNNLFKLVNND